MKRNILCKKLSILLVCLMAMCLVGSADNTAQNNGTQEPNATAENGGENGGEDDTQDDVVAGSETGTGTGAENGNNATQSNDSNATGTAQTGTPQASEANPINDNIRGYYSETTPYPVLENEIIDELDLENMDMTQTRYYYNYVDLDGDEIDEILVQLNGEYNTTKDGDTLLIVKQENTTNDDQDDDGFDIIAKYTAFVNPVIVSDNSTNGYRDLIFMNPKSNPTTYSKITYGKDGYGKMSSATTLNNLDNITGVALLCNDVANDTQNNAGLFFS